MAKNIESITATDRQFNLLRNSAFDNQDMQPAALKRRAGCVPLTFTGTLNSYFLTHGATIAVTEGC